MNVKKLIMEMISIDSSKDTSEISNYIVKQLGKDYDSEIITSGEDELKRDNIVAKKGKGKGGLTFICHLDVVSATCWNEAFEPYVKNGNLYGRGSCDMKGPIAAAIKAADSFSSSDLKKPIYFLFTGDEETESLGAKKLGELSDLLDAKIDGGIITEPTSLVPIYAHKDTAAMKITSNGKESHSSTDKGKSAFYRLIPFFSEFNKLKKKYYTDKSYKCNDFTPNTLGINIRLFGADGPLNVIPGCIEVKIHFRTMPNATEVIPREIEKLALKHELEYELMWYNAPLFSPKDSRIIKTSKQITKKEPKTAAYATDGPKFQNITELVVLGPGNIDVSHSNNEYVSLEELNNSIDIYSKMIRNYCT
jgi:acetylornithine deacetylase